jgi:hypothetical protein
MLMCAELAIFRELQSEDGGKVLYLGPNQLYCQTVYSDWNLRLGKELGLNVYLVDASLTY